MILEVFDFVLDQPQPFYRPSSIYGIVLGELPETALIIRDIRPNCILIFILWGMISEVVAHRHEKSNLLKKKCQS